MRGYEIYWKAYIRPRVQNYALRDFTTAIVAKLLKDIARGHKLNSDTVSKIRSVFCAMFTYAISEGHFPARSASGNPARGARIPEELTNEPEETAVPDREQVQALLKAFEYLPLERCAVALMALGGLRPNEARGLCWEHWDRAQQHLVITQGVWHTIVGTTKTKRSRSFVTVTDELRQILADLWRQQGCPIYGFVLAGTRRDKDGKTKPVILDNLSKRSIADTLNRCSVCHEAQSREHEGHNFRRHENLPRWPGFYALRLFHATQVCVQADSETAANALRNSKEVAKKHYIKPTTVLPKTRKAVNDAFNGLVQ